MTDRPLPETIPAGEYVLLLSKPEGEIVTATVSYHRDDWWLNHRDDWWLNVNSGMALITEAQARHLLAMPGRPHDDRLDGKRTVDRSHWTDRLPGDLYPRLHAPSLDECWCSRVPGAVHPDPGRVHWTEAQRQPGEKRGMRRPETDGGYWYGAPCVDERGLELVGTLEWQPIAPDGTVPVAPKEQA